MRCITKRLTKGLFWTGLTMRVLGVSFTVGNWAWYRTRTWSAIDKPLDLRVGSNRTQEFQVNINEHFLIMLEVDRELPQNIAERVLFAPVVPMWGWLATRKIERHQQELN
jgi:hypothetical protein